MYRANLFIALVAAISAATFYPMGIVILFSVMWLLASSGVPDFTVMLIIGGAALVIVAIIGFLACKIVKPLHSIAPNDTDGIKKILSIFFHLLLAGAHILFILAVHDRIYPKTILSPDGMYVQIHHNDALAIGTMALYIVGILALLFISSKFKPRYMK